MAPQPISRKLCEDLMFGTGLVRRFTQDSPVLPDVWIEYSKSDIGEGDVDDERLTAQTDRHDRHPPVRLLLTPFRETGTGLIAQKLRERLKSERQKKEWLQFGHKPDHQPRVIYNQSTVAAELYFEDVVRVALPMTDWWQRIAKSSLLNRPITEWIALAKNPEIAQRSTGTRERARPELLWMIRVVGVLALTHLGRPLPHGFLENGVSGATDDAWTTIIEAAIDLTANLTSADKSARIYSVSLNRQAGPTVFRSTLSIKADAARRLFAIDCSHLAWAVIDSGIDASHPAFRLRQDKQRAERAKLKAPHFAVDEEGLPLNNTRVKATYDFNGLHLLLDPAKRDELPPRLHDRLAGPHGPALRKHLEDLYLNIEQGRPIDWVVVAPLLEVPHEKDWYYPPINDHGTHVAGILAGDWRTYDGSVDFEDSLTGVCPDLRLYDLRVLDEDGRGDEFAIMAALQLVRHLNGANEYMSIHGVNLSLSIPHDVSNYACGRTPVCDECERVVNGGIVVVTAAGNQGYRKIAAADGLMTELYSSSSITDPGNADLVITDGLRRR